MNKRSNEINFHLKCLQNTPRRRSPGSLVLSRQLRLQMAAHCKRRVPVIRLDNFNRVYIKSVDRPTVNEIQFEMKLVPDNAMYQCISTVKYTLTPDNNGTQRVPLQHRRYSINLIVNVLCVLYCVFNMEEARQMTNCPTAQFLTRVYRRDGRGILPYINLHENQASVA